MKTKKNNIRLDERNVLLALKVIAVMYILTILAIQGIVIYRQMALGQTIHDFKDISAIMIVNSLFLVSALLYFGAIPLRAIKIKTILLVYALIVVIGAVFVFLKYSVFSSSGLSTAQLFNKVLIVGAVTGIIVLFWVILSFLGKRRMEKELED
jgi:hypothetical protein